MGLLPPRASDSSVPAFRPRGPVGIRTEAPGSLSHLQPVKGWSEKEGGSPRPKFGVPETRAYRLAYTHLIDGREIHGGANGHGEKTDCRAAKVWLWPAPSYRLL